MKKFVCICVLMLALVCMIVPVFAFAEEIHPPEEATTLETVAAATAEEAPVIPTEPFTWTYLATISGATLATLLIVQFLKAPLDKVWKIPTRAFVYFISLAILLVATGFTTGLTLNTAFLTVLNAFIVALTAYGSYEITFRKLEH